MADYRVKIAGVEFENPIIAASGSYGFGREYGQFYSLDEIGGISVKGLTLIPREGNDAPRIAETPMGILNSVGLQNPGVDYFLEHELPFLKQFKTKVIANIAGNTIEEYCRMAEKISDSAVDMIEMNISCPNVKEGGVAFGVCPATVEEITHAVRQYAKKPLIVKLSPNVTDITETARAAEAGGADAVSLINTLTGMAIDIHTRRPILHNNIGGLSGPAVKPVAVRMVWQVRQAVNIPIIGMGGISGGEDAVEFLLAGANAVAVGTHHFVDPMAAVRVMEGIKNYMDAYQIERVSDLTGKVQPY
ncbi:MAG: dihydroorotate dehydrogenase [Clostridia bacterium]|nr:dihydroorotate dehydrogenase [Lachnospiraceae bacterium]MCI9627425.1 dihydroorotate dehydrogenase [Clostridia bacterium]